MPEINVKSVSDLPAIEELTDGDYLLAVSAGAGKRIPATQVGGKTTVFDVQLDESVGYYFPYDYYGVRITDPDVARKAIFSGSVLCRVAMDGGYGYSCPINIMDMNADDVNAVLILSIDYMSGGTEVNTFFGDPAMLATATGLSL